jgi:dissimilatory sulfite reductase (desulfoviridin) alpha/beta subunit
MNFLSGKWETDMAVDYATLKKGGFMRQKQKNHFSLRLSVVGGQVSASQLAAITKVAEKYGRGYIHLTSRQGIEIPFIRLEDIDEVKEALAEGGASPGVCGPRVRTITACQGSAVCPNGCIETEELAQELNRRYFGKELPHKFKFGITGCQNNCLKAEENDLGIKGGVRVSWLQEKCISCGVCAKVCREKAIRIEDGNIEIDRGKCNYCGRCAFSCPTDAYETAPGYLLSFGGLFGNKISKGVTVLPFVEDQDTLFRICDAALEFFKENAVPGERFKFTIDRVGQEKLDETIWNAFEGN